MKPPSGRGDGDAIGEFGVAFGWLVHECATTGCRDTAASGLFPSLPAQDTGSNHWVTIVSVPSLDPSGCGGVFGRQAGSGQLLRK